MKESDEKVAAEMQLARFAQKTHGLKMTEMHLRVLSLAEQTDKYFLLVLMDDMMDDLQRNGVRARGAAGALGPEALVGDGILPERGGELREGGGTAAPRGSVGG